MREDGGGGRNGRRRLSGLRPQLGESFETHTKTGTEEKGEEGRTGARQMDRTHE